MSYIYNLTDTWNAGGTTFAGIKMAVTNTASSASSKLLDLSVSGATTASFAVDKSGNLSLNGSVNKVTITPPATGATLTIVDGKTLTANNTLTFTGTDSSSIAFGTGGTVAYTANNLGAFAATTSAQLAGVISDETGSGALVFGTSPTFTTSATGPLFIGGSNTTSTLTLRSTSGAGTTGADIIFQTGNNGATEAARISNSGNFGVGLSPITRLDIKAGSVNFPICRFMKFGSNNAAFAVYIDGADCAWFQLFNASNTETIHLQPNGDSWFSGGKLLIGTTTAGASKLTVADDSIQINTAKTPASATATGTTGQVCWDSSYIYVCTATNTWKRTAIATW